MTNAEELRHIRRILVALDASAASLAALESAAALAARFEAELLGLFVEDINLLRLAGLPFARELSYVQGLARRLEAPDVERAMRVRARLAQEAFARVVTRLSLRSSFRVVRGQVVAELLRAATQADLIALGTCGVEPVPRHRPGLTAHAVALAAASPILLLPAR